MNRLTAAQVQWNVNSRDHWELAGPHRQRVTELITRDVIPGAERLCVLGAGNCNDLDLARLVEAFAEVHLVDLDAGALEAAIVRQRVSGRASIIRHGHCDVTGVWNQLAQWTPRQSAADGELDRVVSAASSFAGPNLPGPFGMVVSVCLLSQLIQGVVDTLGLQHPRLWDVIGAIRHAHLRLLTELTAPDRYGLLVSDVVSSETAPELPSIPQDKLPAALVQMINARNFFHGLNPFVLASLFKSDPVIAPRVATLQLIHPWHWDFGVRCYAVTAIRFRRARSSLVESP